MIQRIKDDLSLPFLAFCAWIILLGVMGVMEVGHSRRADLIAQFASYVGFSWWLTEDARRARYTLPMGYGMLFLFFSTLFCIPYFFETRGRMAFVTIGLYGAIFAVLIAIFILAVTGEHLVSIQKAG